MRVWNLRPHRQAGGDADRRRYSQTRMQHYRAYILGHDGHILRPGRTFLRGTRRKRKPADSLTADVGCGSLTARYLCFCAGRSQGRPVGAVTQPLPSHLSHRAG